MQNKVGKEEGLKESVPDDKDIKKARECRGKLIKKRALWIPASAEAGSKGGVRKRGPKKKYTPGEFVGATGGSTEQFNQVSMMQARKKNGITMNHPDVDGGM